MNIVKESDFSRAVYNIEGIPADQDCINQFPDLLSLAHIFMREDDLPEGVSPDKVLRYLIYMFGPGNPIRDLFVGNIERRKQWTLNKLNIEIAEGETEGYAEMCAMNKPWIADRFIAFCHFFKSADYAMIATADIRMAKYQKMILLADINKAQDEGYYVANLEKWRNAIDKSVANILDGETSKRLEESVVYTIKTDSLGIMPEEFTRAWRDGELFNEIIP